VVQDSELLALLAEARAHLEWEHGLGGVGVPVVQRSPAAQAAGESARARDPSRASQHAAVDGQRPQAPRPSAHQELVAPPASLRGLDSHGAARGGQATHDASPSVRTALAGTARETVTGLPPEARRIRLSQLAAEVAQCTRCELARGRTQTVFARGNPDSPLMFIGEGPGQEEDRTGLPFVGPAGQLLDKMVSAMGYGRDDVYICNVVKCRPPGNRTPLPSEAGACAPFLAGQLEAIAPRVIVALGRCAAENLGLVQGGGWRGRWGVFRGIPVMPTYHPAFLLRSPEFKRPVWEDLQKVMGKLKAP
jgi:DNA polymerase